LDKTRPQAVNAKQVQQFLADAKNRAVTARKNLAFDAEIAFQIAYEAMIKGSLALMLSQGQRPRKQLGHHIAIIEFAQKHLPGAKAGMFSLFDRMRRKRNDAFYDIAIVSETDAREAVATAEQYLQLVSADIQTRLA
jgi:uncharacterized protein (UPF0332 family)